VGQLGQQLEELEQLERLGPIQRLLVMRRTAPIPDQIELLIVQPTRFCNIDCTYCYLPDRNRKGVMTREVLSATAARLAESGHLGEEVTIVWHSGEPMTVDVNFYRYAFEEFCAAVGEKSHLRFVMQTNGTRVDDAWIKFFLETGHKVGVSLDGPAWIHDKNRITRRGNGTHSKVESATRALLEAGADTYVICVITRETLPYATEIYDYFKALSITNVGFNVEEAEGSNRSRSLSDQDLTAELRAFFDQLFECWLNDKKRIHIREFSGLLGAIAEPSFLARPQEASAMKIVSVNIDGDFSTFSPELCGFKVGADRFLFGNVQSSSFDQMLKNKLLRAVEQEIDQGIANCARECGYFSFCGGGTPSNKFFELGNFSGTETSHCRNSKKVIIESVISSLERRLVERIKSGGASGDAN